MTTTITAEVLQDNLAVSLARALTAANKKARELGINVMQSIISITQIYLNGGSIWRINYGPKNYVNLRGGDLIVEVDADSAMIKRVLKGQ
ncbi:MAG: hypothetical protein ONB44_22845 [candidate division KSB1 bacterium]|nr:hypothetical protein [candidate division KSB1 bacterium]MDZ7304977.1 hypothetical protein [candidate division KSB1 bacterium]MDZ7314020.1 hypothetical protein [candidate division KSB1 bacterium]